MNIWEAYCNPSFYNIFFDTLVAKGMAREDAEKVKYQYSIYLQRIKGTRFANELSLCTTKNEFREKLHEMFYDKWSHNIKYEEIPYYYEAYLGFLDSIQALFNDFISESEKERLIDPDPDIPINILTQYEIDYLKDGKLVALMNPQLLFILREYIEDEKIKLRRAAIICETFYGDMLPQMEAKDYSALINNLWNKSRKISKGRKFNQLKVTFPDGKEQIASIKDIAKQIIVFYGIDEVRKRKFSIRNNDFVVKYVPMGKEKNYESINENGSIYISGNSKDLMNVLRAINIGLGNKLIIELV